MPTNVVLIISLIVLVMLASGSATRAESIDPDNDGSQYAWAENVGWLNAEPLGDGGSGIRVLDDRLDGWMWSENTGWISLGCNNTASCTRTSFGVTNSSGVLAGYAWSENTGWISFSCENTSSCGTADYGVTIDQATGDFSGYAWGENIGWVSFSCENTSSCGTVDFRVKTDVPFLSSDMFADSFESGDTSAWSKTVP